MVQSTVDLDIRCITIMSLRCFKCYILSFLAGLYQATAMAVPTLPGYAGLMSTYRHIQPQLSANYFAVPIYLQSSVADNLAQGHVYALLEHPYARVAEQLAAVERWCDIAPLHFNVKGCSSHASDDGDSLLNLYIGRKYYQRTNDAYRIQYHYEVKTSTPSYINLTLHAAEGPLNTHNYVINVEAIPVAPDMTFIHFRYSYEYGLAARLAMKSYLATVGRGKVGFTAVGSNASGEPIYVSGIQGAIERNTMRYFIAIQSDMDTLDGPAIMHFERRLQRWFELTSKYKRQLFELDWEEYLKVKQREHANQLALN